MIWDYASTPYFWPMLASAVFFLLLGIYVWGHRSVPAARPFAIMLVFITLWSFGAALELAAEDLATKVFWFKFLSLMKLPVASAELAFGLQYTGLSRFLSRRNLILLSILPFLVFLLTLTNDILHFLWLGFRWENNLIPQRTILTYLIAGYAYVLGLVVFFIFLRLFIRSPKLRWPVGLILTEVVVARVASMLDYIGVNPFAPMDPVVLTWNAGAAIYAIALFGFRMFDPIPIARNTVIEQMREGMLVLDADRKIMDLNPAVERILGLTAAQVRGRDAKDILPIDAKVSMEKDQVKICLGKGNALRYYIISISPLKNHRNMLLGQLLLLHDATEQEQAQAQLLEQQRALAIFSERERLARELHDGIGQVLGYVKMQAQAARVLLAQDQKATVDSYLENLAEIAQDVHADMREYILGAKTTAAGQPGFLPMLQQYLQRFSQQYALRTELIAPPKGIDEFLEPTVEAQLLRIIQEALTNTRKHACARCAQVLIHFEDSRAQVTIQDDGVGFDPARLANEEGQKYGLGFMRERAEEVGGSVAIYSTQGEGTRVVVNVPLKRDLEIKGTDYA